MKIKFSIKGKIPENIYLNLIQLYEVFERNHFDCYIVGGFIRDLLMNLKLNYDDIDIATNAKPEEIMKLFSRVIPTGIKHGTVTILFKNLKIECTTYRKETTYSDNRHPDSIEYAKTIFEDISRRDFTMNAFAYDIKYEILIDEYEGIKDIQSKIIRTIGNPGDRFLEDGLRPIRAFRFQSKFNFELHKDIELVLFDPNVRKSISSVSIERFSDELWKAFSAPATSAMILSLDKFQILNIFIKNYDVKYSRKLTEYFLNYINQFSSPILKMALWFNYKKFPVREIAKQWKFSNKKIVFLELSLEFFSFIENNHYFFENSSIMDFEYRKFLSKIKQKLLKDIDYFIKEVETYFTHSVFNLKENKININTELIKIYKKILYIIENDPLLIKELDIDGEDIKKFNITGKEIGFILSQLHQIVLKEPEKNRKEVLLKYIPELKP